MRLFLLGGLSIWLFGIIIKQTGVDLRLAIAGAGCLALLAIWRRLPLPYLCALAALGFLGYMRPQLAGTVSSTSCNLTPPVEMTVTRSLQGTDDQQRFLAQASFRCSVLITTTPFPRYQVGDRVRLDGHLIAISTTATTSFLQYAQRQGIVATANFPRLEKIEMVKGWSEAQVERLRQRIDHVFVQPEGGIIAAMLLAQTDALPADVLQRFTRTGVSHILAISGSNISLLAVILYVVLLLLPLSPLTRTVCMAAVMWLYIAAIGAPLSAVRAALFWTLAIWAYQWRRLTNGFSIIIFAATAMITIQPAVIQDVGFQLSLAAVLGIGLALFTFPVHTFSSSWRLLAQSMAVTCGATLATWPITAYYFHSLSFIGLLVNIWIVPLTGLFIIVALLALAFSFVVPWLGLMISFSVHGIWQIMNTSTELAGEVPYGYVAHVVWPPFFIGVYYVVIIVLAWWWLRHQERDWKEIWV